MANRKRYTKYLDVIAILISWLFTLSLYMDWLAPNNNPTAEVLRMYYVMKTAAMPIFCVGGTALLLYRISSALMRIRRRYE